MKILTIYIFIQITTVFNFIYPQGDMILKGEKSNLRGSTILDLIEDEKGNIWMITSTGLSLGNLCKYTTAGEWVDFIDNSEIYNQQFASLSIENNNVVACYYEDGVFIYKGDKWVILNDTTVKEIFNVPSYEWIFRITRDKLNRTWIETRKGLLLCENSSYTRYLEDVDFKKEHTYFKDNHVFSENGIFKFSDNKFEIIIDDVDHQEYWYHGSDKLNRTWYSRRYMGSNNKFCFKIYYHQEGNWVEIPNIFPYVRSYTHFPNFARGDAPKFKYKDLSKFMFECNPKFNFKADSSVWISSGDFVGYFYNGELSRLQIENENIPKRFVFDKIVFNKTIAYIAWNRDPFAKSLKFADGLLVSYDIENHDIFYFTDNYKISDSKNTYIGDMYVDSKGHLWILNNRNKVAGIRSQIIKLVSRENIEVFDSPDNGLEKYLTFIYEDSQERIWIGSLKNGIFMYEYDDI